MVDCEPSERLANMSPLNQIKFSLFLFVDSLEVPSHGNLRVEKKAVVSSFYTRESPPFSEETVNLHEAGKRRILEDL